MASAQVALPSSPTMSMMPHQHHPPHPLPQLKSFTSSKRVRSKFFHRIGILRPTIHHCPPPSNVLPVAQRSVRDLRRVPRFDEPLRYSYNHQHHRTHKRENEKEENGREQPTQKKQVNFRETVTVVPIPMRCEYSDRIKTKLWRGSLETRESIDRNLAEFAAEHYDWRSACHEEEMYFCGDTRELVHPVHVEMGHYTFGTGGSLCQRSYEL
mmetsp:Transcript_14539/g.35039  ORF Transcript_14539/g.35039 Transcript_14539/m.35039 type:complete len:211 (-) Transcript_14539:57-689(-)